MNVGNYTNQGYIIWIDNSSPLISDPLVKTSTGLYRISELTLLSDPNIEIVTEYLINGKWVREVLIEDTRQVKIYKPKINVNGKF
jgi:hypothetical protein